MWKSWPKGTSGIDAVLPRLLITFLLGLSIKNNLKFY